MIKSMENGVRKYLSLIGRSGGIKSRRKLDPQTARAMVLVREARRAFRRFHTLCFWSFDPDYQVTARDVGWVSDQLMKHGGREAWETGARLCR
jgi:hypothetical protein